MPAEAKHLLQSEEETSDLLCSPSSCLCTLLLQSTVSTPSSSESTFSDESSCESVASSYSIFSEPSYVEKRQSAPSSILILDLRPKDMYAASHLRGSHNISLPLTPGDFFHDVEAVERRWGELAAALMRGSWTWTDYRKVLVLCADGDSGRMAAAILRAKGCEALCVEGGFPALCQQLQ
jgi:rhodanese-related sulfurtransferase